ncbi:50S ribosomal protein L4 [Candidatus Daviesbacteria bacterium]|nr:50S ribosomal protein L4 [Candidatus Daviesbacteria bacterium]
MPVKKSLIVNRKSSIVKSQKAERKTINDKRQTKLSVPVYSLAGRSTGTLSLPKEIFGGEVNKKLLAQALRVYTANQKTQPGNTKTRGEVVGSTAKIQRQKGTGRARHGAIRAPIFVGGGIVFGPKPRKVKLDLPKKMKKAALMAALSDKLGNKGILGISGIEKASGKTKEMVKLMSSVVLPFGGPQSSDKKQKSASALIITAEKMDNVVRAVRNIPGMSALPADLINAYEILRHDMLLITKEAVERLSGKVTSNK